MFFERLYRLALQCPLLIAATADPGSGRMTVVITPKVDKDTPEAALRQPLTLTATPAEFDAEFYDALDRYGNSRQSLLEQVEATTEVLNAAKSAQVEKAAQATAKPGKQAASPKKPAVTGDGANSSAHGDESACIGANDDASGSHDPGQAASLFG